MRMQKSVGCRLFALATVVAFAAGSAGAASDTRTGPDATAGAAVKAPETSRLYHVGATAPDALDGTDLCLGHAPILSVIAKLTEEPPSVPPTDKGCTQTNEANANGSFRLETICGSATAGFTFTTRVYGTRDDFHQDIENVQYSEAREPKSITIQHSRMTYLGQCPVTMKPGDYRTPDGEIHDPLANLRKALGRLPSR